MNRLGLVPSLLVFFTLPFAGCATGPLEAYDTNKFLAPPVILNTQGQYSMYVWERTLERNTIGQVRVNPVGPNLEVYVSEMITLISARNGPKVVPLQIPAAFQGQDLTHRFVWLNPDNTTTPMQVVTTPPPQPAP
jgi:hypothetical protein